MRSSQRGVEAIPFRVPHSAFRSEGVVPMAENTGSPAPSGARSQNAIARVTKYNDPISVSVVNRTGTEVGTVSIDPKDFGGKISRQLMHEVVLMHRANQRAGTHSTLRRGEVAGSTKKLFRQKGTGNARAGTKRTNKRVGGGTAKGPKPRDYSYSLPKKAIRAATRMAILSKFIDKEAVIIDDLILAAPKTKEIVGMLKAIKVGKKATESGEKDVTLLDGTVLIGTNGMDANVYKSARNIEGVKVLPAAEFNCFTILKQKRLLLTKAALEALQHPVKPAPGPAAGHERTPRRGRAGRIQKQKAAAK
jgi:large subunit ribosomal protein L4